MRTTEEIFQEYVNLSYEELFARAYDSFLTLHSFLTKSFEDSMTATNAELLLIYTSICADGNLTELEVKFLNDLAGTSFSPDQMLEDISAFCDKEAFEAADNLFDSLPEDEKAEFFNLCLCVCAIDERISSEELDFVARLIQ